MKMVPFARGATNHKIQRLSFGRCAVGKLTQVQVADNRVSVSVFTCMCWDWATKQETLPSSLKVYHAELSKTHGVGGFEPFIVYIKHERVTSAFGECLPVKRKKSQHSTNTFKAFKETT